MGMDLRSPLSLFVSLLPLLAQRLALVFLDVPVLGSCLPFAAVEPQERATNVSEPRQTEQKQNGKPHPAIKQKGWVRAEPGGGLRCVYLKASPAGGAPAARIRWGSGAVILPLS